MSSSTTLPGNSHPPPTTTTTTTNSLTNLGLGYSIAIALAFLVLLATLLLSSYLCCRRRQNPNNNPTTSSDNNGIILPRIIFVAEDDNDDEQNAVVVGLDQSVINSYPRFPFSKDRNNRNSNDSTCSICLCEYREGEMMRMLPDCRHYFHLTCVDAWLKMNASCPVCRNSPLPTPLSTPLAEVVPLSQYAGGRRR